MTTKEALELIKPQHILLLPSTIKKVQAYSVIEKELKILEIFKKYFNIRNIGCWDEVTSIGLELYLQEMPKEEVELLREWLSHNCGWSWEVEDETNYNKMA